MQTDVGWEIGVCGMMVIQPVPMYAQYLWSKTAEKMKCGVTADLTQINAGWGIGV